MGVEDNGGGHGKDEPGKEGDILVSCEVSREEEKDPAQQGCNQANGSMQRENKDFLLIDRIVSQMRDKSTQFFPYEV
jgi:hypothetical protein